MPSMTDHFPRGCVIVLNGYPGVGKLSVAQALVRKIASDHHCSTRLFGIEGPLRSSFSDVVKPLTRDTQTVT